MLVLMCVPDGLGNVACVVELLDSSVDSTYSTDCSSDTGYILLIALEFWSEPVEKSDDSHRIAF